MELFSVIGFLPPDVLSSGVLALSVAEKKMVASAVLGFALFAVVALNCYFPKFRDFCFFAIVSGMVITERMDVNFLSQEWYRGTTRGIEVSLLDVLALGLLISCLLLPRNRPRFYWPASLAFMVLFLLYECFSVAISSPKLFGVFEVTKTMRAILFFLTAAVYVRSARELKILIVALMCAVCLQAVLGLKHRVVLHMERVNGSFNHPNSLSMYLCMTAPLFIAAINAAWSKWVRFAALIGLGAGAFAILLTVSRAGIPIYAAVVILTLLICMRWEITLKKILITTVAAALMGGLVLVSWDSLSARFLEANLEEELDENKFENRGQYIGLVKEIMKDRSFGVGLNNWSYWVSKLYGPRTGTDYRDYDSVLEDLLRSPKMVDIGPNFAPPAHNLGIITLGELGLPGLIIFSLLWLRWFSMGVRFLWPRLADPMYRIGVGLFFGTCGIFLQSLTEWVYRETAILLTFHILMGTLASLCLHRKRVRRAEHQHRRRVLRQREQAAMRPQPVPALSAWSGA